MLGMLCWQERGRLRVERTRVAGLGVLCAYITPGGHRERRQLARAVKLLRRRGVSRMLPGKEYRPDVPIPAAESLPLYRALADQLVLGVLAERGVFPQHATVVLQGEYPDSDLSGAAYRLCPLVRQVIIDTQRGGELLQRGLYREFGASVGAATAEGNTVRVCFGGPPSNAALRLCEQGDVEQHYYIDATGVALPEYLVREAVLCALWQAGLLSLTQLRVGRREQGNKFT